MLHEQFLSTHGGIPSGPGDLHSFKFDKSLTGQFSKQIFMIDIVDVLF